MQFMVQFSLNPENEVPAVSRFKETGAPPPDGVKMVGRWHSAIMHEGFNLIETDDVEALASWCSQWADLLSFRIVPVLSDEQLMKVMSP